MAVLRTIVVFLVGAGIAIGAHFAGLFDRIPHWFGHRPGTYAAPDGGVPADGYPPADGYASDGYAPEGYPADGAVPADAPPGAVDTVVPNGPGEPAPAVEPAGVPPPASGPDAPLSLHLDYRGSAGNGCAPAYTIYNQTGRTVLFSVARGYGPGGAPEQPLRIAPGASAAPVRAGLHGAPGGRVEQSGYEDTDAYGDDDVAGDDIADDDDAGGCGSGTVQIVIGEH